MKLDIPVSLFVTWLNCLFVPEALAARPANVSHQEHVPYAGAAHPGLVMDVFTPPAAHARGKALVCVVSGGFFSGPMMLAGMDPFMKGLAAGSGYTVFAVTHDSLEKAVIGQMIPEIQRAIRFIRFSHTRFGIDPAHIGIMGFSSGGFMALNAGVRGDDGLTTASDPIDRASSRVQAVVAFFPPTDFLNYGSENNINLGRDMLEQFRRAFIDHRDGLGVEQQTALARAISPRYFASRQSAPTLLIHGTDDPIVPLQQSRVFLEAMRAAGAECELRVKQGAGHGWRDMQPDLAAAGRWLDKHLQSTRPAGAPKQRERIRSTIR